MTEEKIITSLFSLYKQRGFITENEIFELLDKSDVSIVATERICKKLITLGAMIVDDNNSCRVSETSVAENKKSGEQTLKESDRSKFDYDALYRTIIKQDTSLTDFINYVNNIRPPQKYEFKNLIVQAKSNNVFAKNRIFEMYIRVALRVAYYFSQKYDLILSDTIQESFVGLLEAIEKFTIGQHDNFINHASFIIRNNINRNRIRNSFCINPPLYLQEMADKIFPAAKYCEYDVSAISINFDVKKYAEEISLLTQINKNEIKKNIAIVLPALSVEQDFNNLLDDVFVDDDIYIKQSEFECEQFDRVTEKILKKEIDNILKKLSARQEIVIRMRYGLINRNIPNYKEILAYHKTLTVLPCQYGTTFTLEECGNFFNITRERVRQIESKAQKRLQILLEKLQ